mmetsp:Transcript_85696/g.118986  ORF Transcript_85696/g.118986 Transcript_85696/m.118986 type:complete len:96 (+) Transcript_85696:645-932(+)
MCGSAVLGNRKDRATHGQKHACCGSTRRRSLAPPFLRLYTATCGLRAPGQVDELDALTMRGIEHFKSWSHTRYEYTPSNKTQGRSRRHVHGPKWR